MQFFGLSEQVTPAVVVHDTLTDKKYIRAPVTAAEIPGFLADFRAGAVPPTIKSEPVPGSQPGPVHVLVGSTFVAEVLESSKDVLVEFYAPWCGHCKQLEPIYAEVAEELAAEEHVVVAKIDATANDFPSDRGFDVKGFPTIYLVKGERREVVLYTGDRSKGDLLGFVRQQAKVASKDEL